MAQVIKYKFLSAEINHGTEEPNIEQIILPVEIICHTKAQYDANLSIAEKEAIPGTIEVSGEFDPEAEEAPTEAERIADLEEAVDMILSGVTE